MKVQIAPDDDRASRDDAVAQAERVRPDLQRLIEENQVLRERIDRSTKRFQTLLDNSTDGVWIVSREGRVLDCNRRAQEIHDQSAEQLIGRHVGELVTPESVDRALASFARVTAGGYVTVDRIRIERPDHRPRTVDFSGCLAPFGEGDVVLALERDVTEGHRLEEQNRQLQRLEAIGQLTGGVAHDFNNILSVILANAHFLLDDVAKDDPRHQDVEEIRRAAESGATLTRQLLAFSRKQVLEPAVVDLNSVVAGLQKMLRRVIGEDIDLIVVPGEDVGTVLADRGQIEQVLMNLVVNARDAMPSGGELRIEIANVDLDEALAVGHGPVVPGRYVQMTVSDTGIGMDEATRLRAFEPFFTTKERGRGTGLGLSTCYGIVKQSGGTIWLDSEPGLGTVFKIYLPRHDEAATPLVERGEVPKLGGRERILLVEDDKSVGAAIQRVLEKHGYRVEVARSCEEVMAAGGEATPLDLIVSDMVIPGGFGPETAVDVASRRGARLLFMSGYTDHVLLRNGGLPHGIKFLQKPFTPETLLRKVREVLDGNAVLGGTGS